jgi:hypothetical protein
MVICDEIPIDVKRAAMSCTDKETIWLVSDDDSGHEAANGPHDKKEGDLLSCFVPSETWSIVWRDNKNYKLSADDETI